ncbi:MAG: ABC transporter ATP-binding protein [Actinobacteria bacterium ATB1]|nr:ABC transporter ATP-binding protein [Actinobacteria bacterium ATB1]GIK99485.1 MAG: ABC transporter ATP-binding protein [Alphaproteobacteria bacterium]
METTPWLLEAQHIQVQFGGIIALQDVSLEVGPGEAVGLIGPNGAGKTTFFNSITGIIAPLRGRVRFMGADITELDVHTRARLGIGRTFQRMELFSGMTVREHLLVALRAHTGVGSMWSDLLTGGRPSDVERSLVEDTAKLVALDDRIDSVVDTLSLGHGRLLELARALMTNPRLLLLDEPSSGLDHVESSELAEVLHAVRRVRSTAYLLVEHDLRLIREATERLYVMEQGYLLAKGPTEAVLSHPRVREAYTGVTA